MSPDRFRHPSLTRFALLFLTAASLASYAAPPVLPSRDDIHSVMAKLSTLTGMPVRRRLRFQSISRAQVASYLDERARDSIKPQEIQNEQAALEFLGFLPVGFDLEKITLALMTEQAAAFYDYDRKSLFLADWAPVSMRDTAVVHELAHALADQNFHLGKYARKVENDDEQSVARQAVIEGQASYLMTAYATDESGNPPFNIHPDPNSYDESVAPSGGDYPVFDHAPLYLRMSLVFPYTWGMGFQSALVDRIGTAGFSEPFRHPPISTREIMHPDAYFAHEPARRVTLPKPPHGFRIIVEGDLGELDHRVLIQQFLSLDIAKKISPECRGGAYRLTENKRDRSRVLFYASEWSSSASAAEFLKVYLKCLKAKSTNIGPVKDLADGFSGHNDRGYFRVSIAAARVSSIEGLPNPL